MFAREPGCGSPQIPPNVVYRAQDLRLRRQIALKFLSCPNDLSTGALERFEREARAASALNHPNICTIYGLEEHGGQPMIAMELIEGETLAARLIRGPPLPLPQAVAVAIRVADALEAAHRKGARPRSDERPLIKRAGLPSNPRNVR